MNAPTISVILPTRGRPHLLPRAVASVLGQTWTDLELIVIDDNPPGERGATCAALTPWIGDRRLIVVENPVSRNASVARNRGLAAARGEWVTYLDDDDAYAPRKLEQQLTLARATGVPVVLCGGRVHLQGRVRLVQCTASAWWGDDLLLRARWGMPFLFHVAGPERFDETLDAAEDAEFAHRLLARCHVDSVQVVPAPLVEIYPQPGRRVNANGAPLRAATARILAARPRAYSHGARRRFVLLTLLAEAKLRRQFGRCALLSMTLLRESRGEDWRACANALLVSGGIARRRWVS